MALHPSTHCTYSSHLNSYLTFCALHNLPQAPTPDTLSFFIVYMPHCIQPHLVMAYLSGVVHYLHPHFPNVCAVQESDLVCCTLHGCSHCLSQPVDDLLWLTQLLCGFFGLLCLGELVWPDSSTLQQYGTLSPCMSVSITASSFSFTVPCHKTDTDFEGDHVLLQQLHADDDPFSLFCMYLLSCNALFPLHPFLWVKADSDIPTCSWFMIHFCCLFPHWSLGGHSLCVGEATSLVLSGVQPTQIQAIG
ncbi:hypothetical protein ID866_11417, partial [Astraeus odoratus]